MKVLLATCWLIFSGVAPLLGTELILPKDYEEQISVWIFERCSKEITAVHVTPFSLKRVSIPVKDKNGLKETKDYVALQLEWVSYGDVSGREGVALLGLYQGVYLFDSGKLVNEVTETSVDWSDGKPQRLSERIWLERAGTAHSVDSFTEQRVVRAISRATVVRYALVEVNGLGEYELKSSIGTLSGQVAKAAAAITVDPRSRNLVTLMCLPKFNLKLVFGSEDDQDVVEMLLCTSCRQSQAWLNRRDLWDTDFTPLAQKELLKILAGELPAISSIPST